MAKADTYQDLLFSLGDLARERLAKKPQRPKSMDRVFKAEDVLLARREELEELERRMNEEDQAYQDFIAESAASRAEEAKTVQRFRKAVEGVEGKAKALRKRSTTAKVDFRYAREAIKKAELRYAELEMSGVSPEKLETSRALLKKQRIALLRQEREVEDLDREFVELLTPNPSLPGAAGIFAHRRIIELEEAELARKSEFDEVMAELDAAIAQKEEELHGAEDYLDQAIYLLGEECYHQRVADPALAALYPKIDRAK